MGEVSRGTLLTLGTAATDDADCSTAVGILGTRPGGGSGIGADWRSAVSSVSVVCQPRPPFLPPLPLPFLTLPVSGESQELV